MVDEGGEMKPQNKLQGGKNQNNELKDVKLLGTRETKHQSWVIILSL